MNRKPIEILKEFDYDRFKQSLIIENKPVSHRKTPYLFHSSISYWLRYIFDNNQYLYFHTVFLISSMVCLIALPFYETNIYRLQDILILAFIYAVFAILSLIGWSINQYQNRRKLTDKIYYRIQNVINDNESKFTVLKLSNNNNTDESLNSVNLLKDLEYTIQYIMDKRQDQVQIMAKVLPFLLIVMIILLFYLFGSFLFLENFQKQNFWQQLGQLGLPSFLALLNIIINFIHEFTFRQELHYYKTQLYLLKRAQLRVHDNN